MQIQLSLIVWTVLCFCALLLILNKLLFTPLLRCMDAREARLAAARQRRRELEEAGQAAAAARSQARQRQRESIGAEAERLICAARAEAEAAILRQQAGEEETTAQFSAVLEAEREAYAVDIAGETAQLSALFLEKLLS